nr:glycoside hydrolase family 43 protein [Spirochaeta thermophila]
MTASCSSVPDRPNLSSLRRSALRVGVSVHDPSIVKAEGKYYVFGSHMVSAVSSDLIRWELLTQGVSKYNRLFSNLFDSEMRAFTYVGRNSQGGYSVWAPDVIYNPVMGKWMMYFCTTSTYIKSNICFATADEVEGPYTYQDTIIYSGFTPDTIAETNVRDFVDEKGVARYFHLNKYNNHLWPNAIDPSLFYDAEGRLWMVYGSWSGGIFILELDKRTGYPIHPGEDPAKGIDPYFGRHLAGGYHNSVEGSYVLFDEETGYYYLFVSYGSLQSNGGYQIRLFRSKYPDGPYTDKRGDTLDRSKSFHYPYGVKLMGNYSFPSFEIAYMAPGHNSAMIDEDGKIFLVHHTRFDDGTEYHELRVRRMFRTGDGWLVASPFAYNGSEEIARGLSREEVAGYYWLINHGTDISSVIKRAEEHLFTPSGRVRDGRGRDVGSWSYEPDTGFVHLQLGGVRCGGLLIHTRDEAGNDTLSISALSDGNESVWAVKYLLP